MHVWKIPDMGMGWGNVVLSLSDIVTRFPDVLVHRGTHDFERYVEFVGINYVDTTDGFLEVSPRIFINPDYFHRVHSIIPRIIRPSEHMRGLIEQYKHLVEGVSFGIHIRRGAYQKDSKNVGCHGLGKDGEPVPAYFAADSALEKFKQIVQMAPGKVFVASDSLEVKQMFAGHNFLETNAVLTYKCDVLKNEDAPSYTAYLEWFLLSMCPKVYITAGNSELGGLSTYGYSAGCYGGCPIEFVFN